MLGGLVLEQSCALCSTRKVLKLSCMHSFLSLTWTFLFSQIKKLHANHHFSEESNQVLAQEDSVIWFLDIFDQKEGVTQISSSAERSFPSQTSSCPPRFPSPTRQALCSRSLGISEGWADPRCC